ncbi:hypothetical protein EJD97_017365 [Solanum chilense]|uniref:Uncharacterized protein n=1 Tax=Solanum chilense TaxID=4083 RepID=A0A6N2BB10_SOLCI|nr:hypothetical protein EJD97_017365 [Solanum chilense]
MSNFRKLEFIPLDIFDKNYLSWVLDAKIHLDTKDLGTTITKDEGLKAEYLTVKEPLELWTRLKERLNQNTFKRKANRCGTSSFNARVTGQLKINNVEKKPSQYNDNIEANLALKNDDFNNLNDITHLEVEDFFGDHNEV